MSGIPKCRPHLRKRQLDTLKGSVEAGLIHRRVIVSANLRSSVMTIFDDNNGHLACENIRDLIQRKDWWPSMMDSRNNVDSCHTCQTINTRAT
ncbi:hypothetical protein MTO96_031281 [Rhipicephalus appendiculatus]